MNEIYLSTIETAKLIGVQPKTMRMWRWNHHYLLPYIKRGNRCFYDKQIIMAFIRDPDKFRGPQLSENARKVFGHIEEVLL